MSKSQEKLKQELMNDIKKEIKQSSEALKLVQNANEIFKQFDSALKKPIDDEQQKLKQKKQVQFIEESQLRQELQATKQKEPKLDQQKLEQKAKENNNKNLKTPPVKTITKAEKDKQEKEKKQQETKPQQIQFVPQPKQSSDSDASQQRQNHRKENNEMIDKYSEALRRSKEKNSEQSKEIQEKDQELYRLNQLTQKQQNQLEIYKEELKNLNDNLKTEKKEKDDIEKQLFEIKQQTRTEILQLKDQLQDAQFKQLELENKSNHLIKLKDSLEQNLKQFENDQENLTKTNQKLAQRAHQDKLTLMDKDSNLERVTKQLQITKEELDTLLRQYKSVDDQHKQLKNDFNKLNNEKNQIQYELDFRRQDQQEYVGTLREKLEKMYEFKKNHEREMVSLQQQLDSAKDDSQTMEIMTVEVDELRKRLKLKEVENEQLQSDNDQLKWKVRKDPNGVLSDLKIMNLQIEQPQNLAKELLQKQENEIRQLQEENNRLSAENKQLVKQIQQDEQYLKELKEMFDRERGYLEDKLYTRDRELNDLMARHKVEMIEQHNKLEDMRRKYETELRQTNQSPYNIPQLQSKVGRK
ncbi:hypothetical protein pb186bvf_012601 [Paramecium bursaria]